MFFIPTVVNIGNLKINSCEHKSTVSIGSNLQSRKNVHAKKNQGFGQQIADFSALVSPIGITFDDDQIDSLSIKNTL
ncbi:hypothetical protein BABA_06796 [Neobacillus bataviensis LMG 21833]|uniref:Uncharacterized protein n=1 Tax=Neobacillus bataviensis LMG 21833 TaxID=1117379 RepID=K6DP24_9BACI|nr:hypothetical protein [Neobacillus bataviensis]EKN70064.1 hypothetical protein BABA_06796 [Neobacillus bataviensis LMG 21833]